MFALMLLGFSWPSQQSIIGTVIVTAFGIIILLVIAGIAWLMSHYNKK